MLLRAISQILLLSFSPMAGASFGLDNPVKVAIIDTESTFIPSPSKQDFHDKWCRK